MFPAILESRICSLEALHLRRRLQPASGIDFTSNDYLGFVCDPVLSDRFHQSCGGLPLSAGGSRLLRGQLDIFNETEETLARFSGREVALLFPSGYQANLGLLSALLRAEDTVFSDELNHASIVDGIKLSRAKKVVYPHHNLTALREALIAQGNTGGIRLIVTESVFSMDGDIAPLRSLADLAEEYDAILIVDEAHATGLFDAGIVKHQGLSERVFATVHTGGKVLGASGAWVAGSTQLRDYLIQFSRPFIYSTAPFPAQALLLKLAVEHWRDVGRKRSKTLFEKVRFFRNELGPSVEVPSTESPILPILIGNTERALKVTDHLQKSGFDIRAIRPPTVPPGGDRLRVILHWQNSEAEILALAQSLKFVLEKERF
ncbi:MAG: 8-amino-7-oxononanoate synthase [Bdellovibrionota bacterium]